MWYPRTLVPRIWFQLRLVVDIDQEHAQVPAASSLSGLEQRLCPAGEDVDGRVPVLLLDVAGCDDAELLMGFVVLALCDPAIMSGRVFPIRFGVCYTDFSCCLAIVFSILDDMMLGSLWGGEEWGFLSLLGTSSAFTLR